jgi:hypothetical protein
VKYHLSTRSKRMAAPRLFDAAPNGVSSWNCTIDAINLFPTTEQTPKRASRLIVSDAVVRIPYKTLCSSMHVADDFLRVGHQCFEFPAGQPLRPVPLVKIPIVVRR